MPAARRLPRLAAPDVAVERRPDGCLVLRSRDPLRPSVPRLSDWLERGADAHPDRLLLHDPEGPVRRRTWGEARADVERLASGLLRLGLGPDRPLAILAPNSLRHALLTWAGHLAGVPVAPLSPAWARSPARLEAALRLLDPGALYAEDELVPFARGLRPAETALLADGSAASVDGLLGEPADAARLDDARAAVGPGSVAKVLFTSGSTAEPKGVVNTHGMLAANQQMVAQAWPFLLDAPPVLVDWLPWNHTFGGNHDLNLVLATGGTLHIDRGRPAPGLLGPTLRLLREVAPTVHFNVPAGWAALLPHLEAEAALRERFFSRLQVAFYAGAALPQDLWERLERVSVRATGERVMPASGWGATETSPATTLVHEAIDRAGVLGAPLPGAEVKLVPTPTEGRWELRVRGPHVTPGYLRRPDLTEAAFDAEGYYRMGDAARLVDPADPARGLLFDGRTAEDFKLLTGTWVRAGVLRPAVLAACSPLLSDALIAGADRAEAGLLAWASDAERGPDLGVTLRERLRAFNAERGSSERIGRFLLLDEPPSAEAGELTDKGYVNQRAALERRAEAVERLYAGGADVVLVPGPPAAE